MISAVVLTKDEEKNLPQCLESIKWVDEVLVIDDNSTDKTSEIAKKFGAKVITHSLNNNFAQQRNFGLQKAKGDWVLFIDADERITSELKKEILNLLHYSSVMEWNGFYFKRYDFWGGRWIKYGDRPRQERGRGLIKILRLGRKEAGRWERSVHEVWKIKGPIGEFKNPLLHYPHPTISEFLKNINDFSSLHAQALFRDGVKTNLFQIIAYPLGKFCQNYLWRLGFLDGTPGIIFAMMMSFHSFLARAKLYFLWEK